MYADRFIRLTTWLVDNLPHSRYSSTNDESADSALTIGGIFLGIVAERENAPPGFGNELYAIRILFFFWQFVVSHETPDEDCGWVYQRKQWRVSLRKRALFFSAGEKASMLLAAALGITIALVVYTIANDIPWCVENYSVSRIPHCLVYEGSLIGRYIQP